MSNYRSDSPAHAHALLPLWREKNRLSRGGGTSRKFRAWRGPRAERRDARPKYTESGRDKREGAWILIEKGCFTPDVVYERALKWTSPKKKNIENVASSLSRVSNRSSAHWVPSQRSSLNLPVGTHTGWETHTNGDFTWYPKHLNYFEMVSIIAPSVSSSVHDTNINSVRKVTTDHELNSWYKSNREVDSFYNRR